MGMNQYYRPHLDALKGLAILLMVMGHVLAWSYSDSSFLHRQIVALPSNLAYSAIVYKIIYSFHMPLLFFVSGYLFFKTNDWTRNYLWITIKKRTQRILIPYVITGFILLAYKGYYGYWFLQVLYILNIIVAIEMYLLRKKKCNGLLEVVMHILVWLFLLVIQKISPINDSGKILYLSNLMSSYPAFVCGVMMKKYDMEQMLKNQYVNIGMLCVFIVSFIGFEYLDLQGVSFHLLRFIRYIALIIFLWNLFVYYSDRMENGFLSYLGKITLQIYLFHLFFVMIFSQVGDFIVSINDMCTNVVFQILYSLIISLVSIFFCIIVSKVLLANKFLNTLLLGK